MQKPASLPIKLVVGLSIFIGVSFVLSPLVSAENLESSSYKIQFGNFNITSGEKSSASYNVTDTVGQTGAGPYGQYGVSSYFVGSGFQYIYQIDRFKFRLSKTAINFGTLLPNIHQTDSHDIAITSGGADGYIVYAYEAYPLKNSLSVDTIPNTTCDSGTCSYTTAGVWNTVTVPGFGYNMSGNDVPAAFVDSTYYKSFADNSVGNPMQVVMSSVNVANNRVATVTYKAGVSNTQASGDYSTYVVFVAVPGY